MPARPRLLSYRLHAVRAMRPMRYAVAWGILLLALLLRALIPAGYMPQVGSAAGTGSGLLPLALCHGMADTDGSALTRWLVEPHEEDAHSSEPEAATHAQSPCLFAVCLSHSALPVGKIRPYPVLQQVQRHWEIRPAVAIARVARFLPLGARAPPVA